MDGCSSCCLHQHNYKVPLFNPIHFEILRRCPRYIVLSDYHHLAALLGCPHFAQPFLVALAQLMKQKENLQ